MNTFHLAIDLGATSGRSLLATFDGLRVDTQEISRFQYPMLPISGHLFWNLPLIYEKVIDSLKKASDILIKKGAVLSSIGIDTWGCDVAFFYNDGTIAGLPYCYRDNHTEGSADIYCAEYGKEELYTRTGIQFMDFNTIFQLHTLRRNNAAVLDAADKILFMPDALSFMLTGKAVTEFTVASTSQMLNIETADFDSDILLSLGLPRHKFGPIIRPGEKIGVLTDEIQRISGLGPVPVIAVAGHDTASAVAGIPTPDSEYAYLSCGTWALLGIEADSYNVGELAQKHNFTNEGGVGGSVRFLKNICGMWIFERIRSELGLEDMPVADLADTCLRSTCDTIINPDDTSFTNPPSMTDAIKTYCTGHSLTPPESTADYVRVIFRSLAARIAEVLVCLQSATTKKIKRLHVIGGASRNSHLMSMIAKATSLPVIAGPAESTALGNIIMQIYALDTSLASDDMRRIALNSCFTETYNP